jgi:two-component system sensor histidine kinase MprB
VPITIHGEADRLERAVTNLLDNAVKYGQGAPIGVRVDRDAAGDAVVTVRDRGPGIAAPHAPHVFERFYRAPEARDAPGSGLGLAIVAQVVDAHGGRVEASAADGGGTVVTMQLPPAPTDG